MILVLFFIVSTTQPDCPHYLRLMREAESVQEAKVSLQMMHSVLSPKEFDEAVMTLLRRIHNYNIPGYPNKLYASEQEKSELTQFLFRLGTGR